MGESSGKVTYSPSCVHMMLAFRGHRMSRPSRLIGVWAEYSSGATIVFPAMRIGTGFVRGIICVVPEKPMVFIDELERGKLRPVPPMHEYVAPVSTMKVCSFPPMRTGMVGSSLGCSEITGNNLSPSGSSGHPYSHSAAGPVHGAAGQYVLIWPALPHPQHSGAGLGESSARLGFDWACLYSCRGGPPPLYCGCRWPFCCCCRGSYWC